MAFCTCLREVYTRLRTWTYCNVVVDLRRVDARRSENECSMVGPLRAHIYLFIAYFCSPYNIQSRFVNSPRQLTMNTGSALTPQLYIQAQTSCSSLIAELSEHGRRRVWSEFPPSTFPTLDFPSFSFSR